MILSLKQVSKSYGAPGTRHHRKVLDKLDLDMEAGACLSVIGPSGSGKTTLLNLIGTLDQPDEGIIRLDGRDISSLDREELSQLRNQQVGFVFQSHHLLPQCNVWENVLLPALPDGRPDEASLERAEQLLKKTGIWEMRWQKPSRLSGGECQRAAVVRALINNPALLLADEPTGALDEENASLIIDLLLELNRATGVTTLVITHSKDLAMRVGSVKRLARGRLETVQ